MILHAEEASPASCGSADCGAEFCPTGHIAAAHWETESGNKVTAESPLSSADKLQTRQLALLSLESLKLQGETKL